MKVPVPMGLFRPPAMKHTGAMTALLSSSMGRLRLIAFIEGMSYILLVFIAMPLKYAADLPQAVRVVGMAHGVLFVTFCLALLMVLIERRLTFVRSVLTFLSAWLPFGTFVIDRYLKKWDTPPT
jgi:integral membrane protein